MHQTTREQCQDPWLCEHPGTGGCHAQAHPRPAPHGRLFPVPTSTNFLCQASRMAPAFSSLQLMSWIS